MSVLIDGYYETGLKQIHRHESHTVKPVLLSELLAEPQRFFADVCPDHATAGYSQEVGQLPRAAADHACRTDPDCTYQ